MITLEKCSRVHKEKEISKKIHHAMKLHFDHDKAHVSINIFV